MIQGETCSWLFIDPWINGVTSEEICWMVSVEFETVYKSVIDDSVLTIVSLRGTRPWSTGRIGAGWV